MTFENISPPQRVTCPHCWQTVAVVAESLTYEVHQAQQGVCHMSDQTLTPLFRLGQVVATPGALEALGEADQLPAEFLERHLYGDWGEVPPEDAQENIRSVRQGFRILSAYTLSTGVKLWIISEADRSVTTLLKPDEY